MVSRDWQRMEILKKLYAPSREDFRNWLEMNHKREKEIWLIYYKKKIGKPCISNDHAVEEALCFGWIDSLIKSIDERKYVKKFTPRRSDSRWSGRNRKKAEKMIQLGLMQESGFLKIKLAKKNGNWDKNPSQNNILHIPFEFINALAENKTARQNFENFAASYRKQYIGWIAAAKKTKTRHDRILKTITSLENNQKLGVK